MNISWFIHWSRHWNPSCIPLRQLSYLLSCRVILMLLPSLWPNVYLILLCILLPELRHSIIVSSQSPCALHNVPCGYLPPRCTVLYHSPTLGHIESLRSPEPFGHRWGQAEEAREGKGSLDTLSARTTGAVWGIVPGPEAQRPQVKPLGATCGQVATSWTALV